MAEIPRISNDFKVKIRLSEEFGSGKSRTTCQIFEDKQKKIPAVVKFDTSHARVATNEIATHLIELGHKTASDHERVLMVFVQSNRDCHGAEDTLVALKLRPISRGTERCVHRARAHVLKTGGMTELDKEMQGALVFQWASAR